MNAPVVTREDLRDLLNSTSEDPVLYLSAGTDDEGGPLQPEVWDEAYVATSKVLLHRWELVDVVGEEPDDADLDDYLEQLEQTVEAVVSALK